MKRAGGLHHERQTATARRLYRETRGETAEAERAREIAALPAVQWKGRTLYTLRCQGDYGKGPHDQNLPEATLWALFDLRVYRCPYHCC